MGGHKRFIHSNHFEDDELAKYLGLLSEHEEVDDDTPAHQPQAALKALRQQHRQAERTANLARTPAVLDQNIQQLRDLIALSPTDTLLLTFAALLHQYPQLESAASQLGLLNIDQAVRQLAGLLQCPMAEIREALSPQGQLSQSGLLTFSMEGRSHLKEQLEFPSYRFSDRIVSFRTSPMDLFSDQLKPSPEPELSLEDYQHLPWVKDLLLPYLSTCLEQGRSGVNIMLYGPPGTGKTQLAQVLAQALAQPLLEISYEESGGSGMSGYARFRAYRFAQFLLAKRPALLLFDEAEDAFGTGLGWLNARPSKSIGMAQSHKAWTNHLLENNSVPTLWICNSIATLDPAFARRFDFIQAVPVPSRAQRLRIIQASANTLLQDRDIQRLADTPTLVPGVIRRAVHVVQTLQDKLEPDQCSAAISHLVSSTLEAQGHQPLPPAHRHDPAADYDPSLVQADADLAAIARQLATAQSARLCLYGPPGTGKTAYGHWLARQLDKPLLLKRASDLLSPYVGETEQNIARAFHEAIRDEALLIIDEVDSFLQNRQHTQRTWKVSQINEMLTQMESFPGLFIASTNLMDDLDPAAMRRFDLKIRFDYLTPPQLESLLRRSCEELRLSPPNPTELASLQKLTTLTPGDFLVIRQQHRFQPLLNTSALIQALSREQALKPDKRSTMGFV